MDRFQRYGNLLRFDGTNQSQRILPALEPDYILPDERSLADLLEYAHRLAAEIRFYNLTGQPTGDWRPFLDSFVDGSTGKILNSSALEIALQTRRDWPPHVALFLVFLQLFKYLQSDLNELPQKHLRHYYENELNLLRRAAVADEVHVLFELARNAIPTLLSPQTLLDAGKDSQGRPLYYATQTELVVNAAKVSDIRRLVGETDRRGFRQFFVREGIAEQEGESWYTFGRKQLDLDASQQFMREAEMGFAIASPLLLLAEGERQLTLTAELRPGKMGYPPAQGLNLAFAVDLTSEKGWFQPDRVTASLIDPPPANGTDLPLVLQIRLTLNEAAPAIVAFDPVLHGGAPVSLYPVLRCRLNNASGHYETLDGLTVERINLSVRVTGVKKLVVQTQQGLLTPDQPMPLFGNQPRLGSTFYIGSAEVFSKRLTELALRLQWQNLPDSLLNHYRAYFDHIDNTLADIFNTLFTASVDLLYERNWYRLLPNQLLFDPANPTLSNMTASASAFESALINASYTSNPELRELDSYKVDTKNGFIRLILQRPTRADTNTAFEAFGHQMFATRYARQAIALSRWNGIGIAPQLPNEPWTPTLASLSLDYSAVSSFVPGTRSSQETFFNLEPFGYATATSLVPARLVPKLERETTRQTEDEFAFGAALSTFVLGVLYLGIEGLKPPANLSLLFQIDQGTATATPALERAATQWSYLSGNLWHTLPSAAVLSDSTYGFQQPGSVVLSIPKDATIDHTLMPKGLVWLRALIRQDPASAARTLALHSQAVLARVMSDVNSLQDHATHIQSGLPAGTIKRLKQRNAAIKSVSQPYASFGGRTSETDADFFRRCSERLRHRNRAITIWDFERLVLEAFPEVFKVKCLPHSDASGKAKAGEIALVIIPDVRKTESINPLEPRSSAVLIGRIQDYVNQGLSTLFSTVHVIHPVYERIRVDARVAFQADLDAGYYAGILNEELRRFLSPWAYEEGQDIVFGARIYKSEILAFMEGRSYVDYITDFQLYHSYDGPKSGGIGQMTIGVDFIIRPDLRPAILQMQIGNDLVVGRGVEVADATRPHAILVSHTEHRIIPTDASQHRCYGVDQLGIGYMTVGLDFKVYTQT